MWEGSRVGASEGSRSGARDIRRGGAKEGKQGQGNVAGLVGRERSSDGGAGERVAGVGQESAMYLTNKAQAFASSFGIADLACQLIIVLRQLPHELGC